MKAVRIVLIIAALVLLGVRQGVTIPSLPVPVTVEAPSEDLQVLVLPVKEKISSSPVKAGELSRFYDAFADVVERDAGEIVANTLVLERVHRSALTLYGFSVGPMVGVEIDRAIAAHLGIKHDDEGYEPGPVDHKRLVEILRALSWAASA